MNYVKLNKMMVNKNWIRWIGELGWVSHNDPISEDSKYGDDDADVL